MLDRIVIVGPSGAGKSTLAFRLGAILPHRLIHLDAEYWQPGWIEPSKRWWNDRVRDLLVGERWIMDGNYNGTMDVRFAAADTIVFLDFSTWRCVWNVIKRVARFGGRTRPDMAAGCPERVDWEFMEYVLAFRKTFRPAILRRIEIYGAGRDVFVLRDYDAVERFLEHVRSHA